MVAEALHAISSLLCTATNDIPHNRLFSYERKSSFGQNIPSWLLEADKALLKKYVKNSKYDADNEEVEIVQPNAQYATVRHASGRESNVSLRHLAPLPSSTLTPPKTHNDENQRAGDIFPTTILDGNIPNVQNGTQISTPPPVRAEIPAQLPSEQPSSRPSGTQNEVEHQVDVRRSTRERERPIRYGDYVTDFSGKGSLSGKGG